MSYLLLHRMADLFDSAPPKKPYWDKKTYDSLEEQTEALSKSSTLYVGNLSFYTSESQIYELFSTVGTVVRVIMGLDRFKKTPCGFCFVQFKTHDQALACKHFLATTKLDDRLVRCELDGGFKEGRQFGRGSSGGQVRDDRRGVTDYDEGRGGYGKGTDYTGMSNGGAERPFRRSRGAIRNQRHRDDDDDSHGRGGHRDNDDEEEGVGGDREGEEEEETNPRFRKRKSSMDDDEDALGGAMTKDGDDADAMDEN